ncbi:MAG: DUF3180 domain-containing protein [Nocardioides sp.]
MSRDPSGGPHAGPPDGSERDDRLEGRLSQTPPGPITVALVVGLLGGWLVRRVASYAGSPAPLVTWSQALVLFLGAAILGVTAWHTGRALDGSQRRPEPHRLVNRLVLARACVLVGALVAGGYLGYALSWLGAESELAGQRAGRAVLAGLGGLLVLVMALWLERACRVRSQDDSP